MRVARPTIPFLFACFFLTSSLVAQNTSTSAPQAISALQSALTALTGRSAVSDVTLTGSVDWIAGSDNESGTATLKALLGASRLDVVLSSGTRSEIRSNATGRLTGNWIGPNGVSHAMAFHNLASDAGWFPAFTLENLASSSNTVLTYVGPETRDGASVIHITGSQLFPNLSGDSATIAQHLTKVDLYLDPASFLPVFYVFNSHPDNNELLDIPTEIRYSNYQNIGGAQIPLHVQKFINNVLALDLQFQKASLNTGITAAQISAQ